MWVRKRVQSARSSNRSWSRHWPSCCVEKRRARLRERVGDRLDVLDPLAAVQRRFLDLGEEREVLDRRVIGSRRLEGHVLAARDPDLRTIQPASWATTRSTSTVVSGISHSVSSRANSSAGTVNSATRLIVRCCISVYKETLVITTASRASSTSPPCQLPVLLAAVLYAEHHRLIRERGYDVLSERPTLTAWRRARVVLRT